jgi:hypothetical protein
VKSVRGLNSHGTKCGGNRGQRTDYLGTETLSLGLDFRCLPSVEHWIANRFFGYLIQLLHPHERESEMFSQLAQDHVMAGCHHFSDLAYLDSLPRYVLCVRDDWTGCFRVGSSAVSTLHFD